MNPLLITRNLYMKLCDEKNMCHSRSLAPTDAVHQIPNEKKIRYTKWTINKMANKMHASSKIN